MSDFNSTGPGSRSTSNRRPVPAPIPRYIADRLTEHGRVPGPIPVELAKTLSSYGLDVALVLASYGVGPDDLGPCLVRLDELTAGRARTTSGPRPREAANRGPREAPRLTEPARLYARAFAAVGIGSGHSGTLIAMKERSDKIAAALQHEGASNWSAALASLRLRTPLSVYRASQTCRFG